MLVATALFSGCTGGYYTPSFTGPTAPEPELLTVTITDTGVDLAQAISPRAIVQFVNRDSRVHDIRSDTHPGHADCAELNIGVIQPGHNVAILRPFEAGRVCRYHDESNPTDHRFQGSINIR
jgi:hypothetical protein